ncbi:hypothetical protein ACWAUC_20465 [Bradyrhizobium guangdongense]
MQSNWPLVRLWTAEDHERLKSMAEAGLRPDEIASKLKRSEKAVRACAWQHGIALRLIAPKSASRTRLPAKR